MTDLAVVLQPPHAAQYKIETEARRFNLIRAGRRFGKDVEMQRRLVTIALNSREPVAWMAPTYKMLRDNFRAMRDCLQPVLVRANESEFMFELLTGNLIEMWSMENADAVRGRHYKHVAINEAAMVKDIVAIWDLIIRPSLMDLHGSADFGTTPRGLNGFFTLWQRAEHDSMWSRFHFTSYDNPYIDPAEIDMLKATQPERAFKQEILAEFLENGSFFQNIDAAAVIKTRDRPEDHVGHTILGGLDWAKQHDFTALTLACLECNKVVDWDHFNQIDYTYQRDRIFDRCKRWDVRGLLAERNSTGEPNIEILSDMGLIMLNGPDGRPGFYTSPTTKPLMVENLAVGLEHDGFLVPEEYREELQVYEAMPGQKFSAPNGMYDDRVVSLGLVRFAMTRLYSAFGGVHV